MNHIARRTANYSVKDKLHWAIKDQLFEDGSTVQDWHKIERSPWIPQEEGYELSFDIYRHDGQFWKLYIARWIPQGRSGYAYAYGGVACRMAQVEYRTDAVSPHSGVVKKSGALEWVRVAEIDETIHQVVRKGDG